MAKGNTVSTYSLYKFVLYCTADADGNLRVVAPAALVLMIFEDFHSFLSGIHLGIFLSIQKIRRFSVGRRMNRNMHERVRQCKICAPSKPA